MSLHTLTTFFSARHLPAMTRPTYRRERVTAVTLPVVVSMFEVGVVGVLARAGFGVGDLAFACILASPFCANATSFVWARLARGRRKVPTITLLMSLVLLATAGLAAMPTPVPGQPPSPMLEWGFVVYIIATRCLLAGVVTLRSTLWRNNYPRRSRGKVTSRLIMLATTVIAASAPLLYRLLDHDVEMFRVVYPIAAVIALVGVIAFSRIRLRGERLLLKHEMEDAARPQRRGDRGALYEYVAPSPGDTPSSAPTPEIQARFWSVLRNDPTFRRYMLWQFVMGISNLIGEAAFITLIIEMVRRFGDVQYSLTTMLTVTVPFTLAAFSLPLWSRYLDRVHIVEFRTRHTILFVQAQLGYLLGALLNSLPVFAAARVIQGLARGGGMLAWNLGHNDFAERRLVATYMSIHVTLTGIRGAVAPFIAVVLLNGWGDHAVGGVLPAFNGLGPWTFAATAAGSFVGWAGYVTLYLKVKRDGQLTMKD